MCPQNIYSYDAIGRRYQKTVNGALTTYQWLGSQLIAEYELNQLTKSYSYADGYAPIEVSDGTNTYTVYNDHLDTPRYLADQNGTIVWTNLPSPYGISAVNEDPDGDGNTVTFNFRFPGQYYDEESGLHYNYFRYYDSSSGRYITSDPIGLDGGINSYIYVYGSPTVKFDLYGLSVCRKVCRVIKKHIVGVMICTVLCTGDGPRPKEHPKLPPPPRPVPTEPPKPPKPNMCTLN